MHRKHCTHAHTHPPFRTPHPTASLRTVNCARQSPMEGSAGQPAGGSGGQATRAHTPGGRNPQALSQHTQPRDLNQPEADKQKDAQMQSRSQGRSPGRPACQRAIRQLGTHAGARSSQHWPQGAAQPPSPQSPSTQPSMTNSTPRNKRRWAAGGTAGHMQPRYGHMQPARSAPRAAPRHLTTP